ncbi:MAG: FMN-binding glutamate synthase family protein [Gammaproteobacteria bacterium]|jgi:glutamate synthase domain-containing protein 2|nr:FMN-binding glutamate synthase family protein [Gammaproteobacteria bacterium]
MRRKFYLAFAIVLLAIALFFTMLHDLRWFSLILAPLILIGVYDFFQRSHTILRNFPILGHLRFILEFIRPEIQQYFIASDHSERPFDRETRSIVYQRAKNVRDTIPFGSDQEFKKPGYEWLLHSLSPKHVSEVESRILVGGKDCTQPYSASRLNISAMSFGSLSANAVMAMNKGAQIGNFAQNTGEGGLSEYHLQGGDIIWQIGTGYFGCRDSNGKFSPEEFAKEATRPEVKMIEIKLSQGAKPSHGGILPAAKLTAEIARIRKVPMGQDVLSPSAHTAFNSPEGLLKFVQELRTLSGGKPVGFKLCIGRRSQFLGICKAMLKTGILPDFITVDGAEGGTGAAPLEFANHVGTPLNEGLLFVNNALTGIGVRQNIRIIAAGKIATGFDMVVKMALGADMCNAARAMMLATGCIQSMQCNTNACPTGVTTQDKRLQRGLVVDEKKHRVAHYHANTLHSFLELIGAMGIANPSDINPAYVMHRVDTERFKPFSEVFEYLKPNCLLNDDIPENFKFHWQKASAESF